MRSPTKCIYMSFSGVFGSRCSRMSYICQCSVKIYWTWPCSHFAFRKMEKSRMGTMQFSLFYRSTVLPDKRCPSVEWIKSKHNKNIGQASSFFFSFWFYDEWLKNSIYNTGLSTTQKYLSSLRTCTSQGPKQTKSTSSGNDWHASSNTRWPWCQTTGV